MSILSKQQEIALETIREKHLRRKDAARSAHKDYGVKGMKWGVHKEKVDDALRCSKQARNYAKAFIPKDGFSAEDRDAVKVALNWGDRAHYERLTDKQMDCLSKAMEKGKKLAGEVTAQSKTADTEKKLEQLHKQAYKAQKYGNNESGDFETSDKLEKEINRLEKELQSSKK